MRLLCCAASAILLTTLFPALLPADTDEDRPRVGLVLSGGGARGGAHIGILKALEKLNVPIDYIAATSMGAIIGGFYAAGYSASEIETIVQNIDWERALSDRPDRRDRTMRKKQLEDEFLIPYRVGFNDGGVQLPLGVVEGQHLDQIFHRILLPVVDIRDFGDLHIPFRAVATDLVTGEEVVLSSGSLPDALRASMSVPGIFAPVRLDGRLLVDGGMSNNLPVSVVREMGAEVVIAVDISEQLLREDELTSVLSVTEQLTNFLVRRSMEEQIESLGSHDLLTVPDLSDLASADFSQMASVVEQGVQAAMAARADLAVLARRGMPAERHERPARQIVVEFIELDNESVLDDEIIRSRLDVGVGQPLDLDALHRSLDRIYSLDVFESVTYDLVGNTQGQQGLRVSAVPRDWGPNYLQFGLELSSDFSGNSDFRLGAAYTRNALNRLGGDMRMELSIGREDELSFDWYQPVDSQANWFVQPRVFWRRENYGIWLADSQVARLEITGWGSDFAIGRNFSSTDRASLTYGFARGDADVNIGDPDFPLDDEIRIGELLLEYHHDSLDSLWFPTDGMKHLLGYRYAADALGAAFDYRQAEARGTLVGSAGKNSFLVNYELGYSFDDAAPVERWYRIGGLGRLSGLVPDQLSGRHSALLSMAYYRRLNEVQLLPAYAGFTLEAGNVWNRGTDIGFDDLRYGGSFFIGAETPIGPVYLAWGISDDGDNTAYFYVGNPFRFDRFY